MFNGCQGGATGGPVEPGHRSGVLFCETWKATLYEYTPYSVPADLDEHFARNRRMASPSAEERLISLAVGGAEVPVQVLSSGSSDEPYHRYDTQVWDAESERLRWAFCERIGADPEQPGNCGPALASLLADGLPTGPDYPWTRVEHLGLTPPEHCLGFLEGNGIAFECASTMRYSVHWYDDQVSAAEAVDMLLYDAQHEPPQECEVLGAPGTCAIGISGGLVTRIGARIQDGQVWAATCWESEPLAEHSMCGQLLQFDVP